MSDKEQEILTQEAAVKNVNNAALADATRRQKPSLFTKRMFKVGAPEFEIIRCESC